MKTWKAPYRREVSKPEFMTIILKCKEEKTLSPVGAGLDKPALDSGRFHSSMSYIFFKGMKQNTIQSNALPQTKHNKCQF